MATKLLFIPPYEILIDFFRAVIYLKKIEEGAGIFHVTSSQSCQNTLLSSLFTSLSLLKAQSYLALADAALHVVGRRKRRRWQSNNIICYMWRKKGRNGIAKLSLPRSGGDATICLSNPESFPYFYCSMRFNIMTWSSKRTSHLTFKNIPWSKYLDIIREFSGMHKIQERVAREGQMSDREACEVRRHRGRQMCDPIPARRCCWEPESRRPLFPMSKNWGGNCS